MVNWTKVKRAVTNPGLYSLIAPELTDEQAEKLLTAPDNIWETLQLEYNIHKKQNGLSESTLREAIYHSGINI